MDVFKLLEKDPERTETQAVKNPAGDTSASHVHRVWYEGKRSRLTREHGEMGRK